MSRPVSISDPIELAFYANSSGLLLAAVECGLRTAQFHDLMQVVFLWYCYNNIFLTYPSHTFKFFRLSASRSIHIQCNYDGKVYVSAIWANETDSQYKYLL